MKKILLSLTLMLVSLAAWAEAGFCVVTNGGYTVGYVFTDEPVWTFEGENLVITTVEGSVEYPMSEVAQIVFGDNAPVSGLTEVSVDELIRVNHGGVELAGFAANTVVSVYNLQGQVVATGKDNVGLSHLSRGIYVVHGRNGSHVTTIKVTI